MKNSEKYGQNESLLQSYRSIFMASQSIMVSAVAITNSTTEILALIITIIALFQLIVGVEVIKARAKIVDFYKYDLKDKYNKEGTPLQEGEQCLNEYTYVHNRVVRKLINNQENIKNWRKTRIKIDIMIPVSFAIIWICFLIHIINNLLHCIC